MARIEIELDDHQYETARRQADAAGMTLADFVQQAFDTRFPKSFDQTEALARLMRAASTNWGTPVGPIPKRDELYAERIDKLVRRHERPDLHDRSAGFGEAGQSEILDGPSDGNIQPDPEPAKPE